YLDPPAALLAPFRGTPVNDSTPAPTLYQPGIRTPYVHSYSLTLGHQLTNGLFVEINGLGSLGRKLITTDIINRPLTRPLPQQPLRLGAINPALPLTNSRANQGQSNYHALAVSARYRSSFALFQGSYTWSKTIDNQSEPLPGDLQDLSGSGLGGGN